MVDRSIAIGIDPTGAQTGGAVVKRTLGEIGDAAVATEQKVDRAKRALGQAGDAGRAANDNLKNLGNSINGTSNGFNAMASNLSIVTAGFGRFIAIMGGVIAALGAFLGSIIAMKQFVTNTIEANKVQAQLAAVIRSTGAAAGQTLESLNNMSAALQAVTSFEDDAIGKSQALLLTFTSIKGTTFERAQKSILDLATAMGGDLQGATIQVGKALNDPIQGISALSRVGIQFTDTQKQMITGFVNSNQLARAQAVILDELQREFGGSAIAARQELGGALDALGNTWGNLFELGKGATEGLRTSIESLITALNNPAFQSFVTIVGTGFVTALQNVVDIATQVVNVISLINENLEKIAPYATAAGAALLVAFGPAMATSLGTIVTLMGEGFVSAIGAATSAMITFTLSNPFTAILEGIVLAVTAIYYFRDEIKKAIGVDVGDILKTVGNTIINSFRAAFDDVKTVVQNFPTIIGAAMIGMVNIIIENLNSLINAFRFAIDKMIAVANYIPGVNLQRLNLDENILPPLENPYFEQLKTMMDEREKRIKDIMSSDPLGDMFGHKGDLSKPGATPTTTIPGTTPGAADDTQKMSDALTALVKSAQDNIREQQTLATQLKMTGYEASVYAEQMKLINQAAAQNISLTPQQAAALKALGEEMARLKSITAAETMIQDQSKQMDTLIRERELIHASAEERARGLAILQAEQAMTEKGIDLNSQYAQTIKNNAAALAQAKLENERMQAAWQSWQQTGSSMVDTLVNGMTTVGSSWKDTLKNMGMQFLQFFNQLAIANPIKNALFGTNLPTISDLFSGKPLSALAGAQTTASMNVTAGTVFVNGAVPGLGGLPGMFPTAPGAAANAVTNGVRPTLTNNGIVNNPVAAAAVNGVRPEYVAGQLVNGTASQLSTTTVAGMPAGLSANEQLVWQHFAAQGLPNYQISAIMGNIKAESSFNPGIVGDNGNALGLAQWNDRGPAMQRFVGADWRTNPQGQLAFMDHEFATSESASWARLRSSTNVTEANNAMLGYERPSGYSATNPMGASQYTNRLNYSNQYLQGSQTAGQQTNLLPAAQTANQSLSKLSTTSAKTDTNIGQLASSATDTSKALTTSTSSVASSATSLASTTAQVPQQTQGLLGTLTSSLGNLFKSIGSGIGNIFGSLFGGLFANGAAFSNGQVTAFATGGVVDRPTLFPMASGIGLMGERGPEAIMPLMRGRNGRLGISAYGNDNRPPSNTNIHITYESHVRVDGVRDKELLEQIHKNTNEQIEQGMGHFSREVLPERMRDIKNDKWARG